MTPTTASTSPKTLRQRKAIGTIGYMGGLPAIDADWVWSWTQMIQFNAQYLETPDTYIHYDRATVSWHELARNGIVNNMHGRWLFMLDCDHIFSPDVLQRLLFVMEQYNLQVVSGLYLYKAPPHLPVATLWSPKDTPGPCIPLAGWDPQKPLVEIGTCGAGCLLIRRDVFTRIKDAFPKEAPFQIRQGLSEDYSFFDRLRDLEIPAYLYTEVQAHHTIKHLLDVRDYFPWDVKTVKTVTNKGVIVSATPQDDPSVDGPYQGDQMVERGPQ